MTKPANCEYERQFVPQQDSEIGTKFGVRYADAHHHIGPEPSRVDDYIRKNVVKL